jgi:hypothetical protein
VVGWRSELGGGDGGHDRLEHHWRLLRSARVVGGGGRCGLRRGGGWRGGSRINCRRGQHSTKIIMKIKHAVTEVEISNNTIIIWNTIN